ncbi:MAG: type II secretion system F family protein [Lachnospiraceae bacterium]|nr:type II secretion system F family protein [Lachnospiraceae bacterium]
MASFSYVAIDSKGKQVKSSIEADNQIKASEQLKRDGFTIIELKEQSMMNKDIDLGGLIKKRVKIRDLSLFCRQFVSLHRAGVTIIESMRMLTEQTENPTLREALQEVSASIQKGETLASSMRARSDVFPPLLAHMVAAGEASGSLDIAFERMAVQFEQSAKINGMIKKAMVYPIMVLVVAVVVVIVMLTFVVPTFMEMFADMEIDMPKITLMVVAASEFMQQYWYIVVGIILALVVFFRYFSQTPTGKGIIHKALIKMPLFGDLTVKSSSAKFARNLSTMLAAGIAMPEAVQIVGDTMNNIYYEECMKNAREDVMQGIPLSTPLEKSGLFPPMVYHMTRIGEETGNTEDMLDTLADYYEEEVEMATQSLMSALEPLIIILLAGVCGTIIGSVMAPMAAMYEGLDSL